MNLQPLTIGMIEASNLTKNFQNHTEVNRINLDIEQDHIFGLFVPNASGKTTSIWMLCGVLQADKVGCYVAYY